MSTGTDSGDEASGPLSTASSPWLTSAMLKLNRQNEWFPQPLPPGPLIGGEGMPITRPDGAGQPPEEAGQRTRNTSDNLVPGGKNVLKPKFRGSIKTFNYISKISYSATVNIRS